MDTAAVPRAGSRSGGKSGPGWERAAGAAAGYGTLLAALAALATAAIALSTLSATRDQLRQAEQGQITTRYTAAVAQLGDPAPEVRLGGIYGLERLARDSPPDQPTVVEVLSAYLRTRLPRAGNPSCPPGRGVTGREPPPAAGDLSAALSVLSRRDRARDQAATVDLSSSCLSALSPRELARTDFSHAVLRDVGLSGVQLDTGRFASADLTGADLTNTTSTDSDFTAATLKKATMRGAALLGQFAGADFSLADLTSARMGDDFTRATFTLATLTEANFDFTTLSGASLRGADLTNASLINARMDGAHLELAKLVNTNLSRADLFHASLVFRPFAGIATDAADLTGADLRGAQNVMLDGTVGRPAFGPAG